MKQKNKTIAAWIAFLFVVLHLTFISLYAAPPAYVSAPVKAVVTPYVSPLFEQSWSMFAPCPVVSGHLKVKITYATKEMDWFYPTKEPREWHSYLRGSHHSELVLLEANMIYWVNCDVQDLQLNLSEPIPDYLIDSFKHGYSYWMMNRYLYGLALKISDEKPLKAEVIAELNNVKTGEEGFLTYPPMEW